MVHRLHRDWALADAQYAVDWCEVVVRGCKSSRAAGDGGGAHAGGGSCSGAARGRAADDGAGFAVDKAGDGLSQGRVGCAIEPGLRIGSHREVRLGDADRAAGRTQGVVVGREATVAAGAQSQIGDVGQKLVGLHVFDSQIGCTSAAHGEGLTVHTGCSQIAARHRRAAVIGLRARECQVGLVDGQCAIDWREIVVAGTQAGGAAGDGGGAHAGGGSCSGAARGRAADDGAGFAVDKAGDGLSQGRVGCAIEPGLRISSNGEVRLGDADRAAGRTQGVVVGREAAVAAGAKA